MARLASTPYVQYRWLIPVAGERDHVTDFEASALPVPPSGYWPIFALLSADDSSDASPVAAHTTLSWLRSNTVLAIASSLADAYSTNRPPPDASIDDALRQVLAHLDDARTDDTPWVRHANPLVSTTSTLLAFFRSREARAARRHYRRGAHVLGPPLWKFRRTRVQRARCCARGMWKSSFGDRDGDGVAFPSRGSLLDAASLEVESIEVREGDFLVLGTHNTWTLLAGEEAVHAVSGWMREQQEEEEVSPPAERPAHGGARWLRDPFFKFPWKDGQGLGLDWVCTMIPDLFDLGRR